MAKSQRYNGLSKALHWLIVALLLAQFVLILARHLLEHADAHDAYLEFQLVTIHKSIGLSILALAPVRLLWRWIGGLPEWLEGLADWEPKAFTTVENWLYALLFLVPTAGAASALASGQPLLWFGRVVLDAQMPPASWLVALALLVHALLVYALIGTFALHLGLVLRRTFFERDAYHRRMYFRAPDRREI